jgi:hypothetical protein
LVTNRRTAEDDGEDFYPTPAWATHALMLNEKFEGSIWEPACGDGAMAEVIKQYMTDSQSLSCSDLYDHGYGAVGSDFLAYATRSDVSVDNIITNPPYNIADEFVLKALEAAEKKVAMLVRLAYLEGQERFKTIYNVQPPTRVWVLSLNVLLFTKRALLRKVAEQLHTHGLYGINMILVRLH